MHCSQLDMLESLLQGFQRWHHLLATPQHVWLVVPSQHRGESAANAESFLKRCPSCINAAVLLIQENCRAGQPDAKPKAKCVQKTNPVLEALYGMYSPDDIASQLQFHTKG